MSKKTFMDELNPAMQFISTQQEAPQGYKPNPLYIETKSRRLQLLIKPSIYNKIKERAKAENRSVNDLINTILEENI